MYSSLKERIIQLQSIDESNYSFENLKTFSEKKLNNLLLDFFLREKFLDTAKNYIVEEKIKGGEVEYSIFMEIQKILDSLSKRDLSEALSWCNTNKSKLTKLNSSIRFKVLKQQFLEIFKSGNKIDAVKFARENFVGVADEYFKELSEVMLLLAIKPENLTQWPKTAYFLSDDRWRDLESDFKSVFFSVYNMKSSSTLETLFQCGLMSLKTPFCFTSETKNKRCPICCEEIGLLANNLPSSHHPVTALICRVSNHIMDHLNPPIALPNGQIYSEKATSVELNVNGKIRDPQSHQEFKAETLKKVYIC